MEPTVTSGSGFNLFVVGECVTENPADTFDYNTTLLAAPTFLRTTRMPMMPNEFDVAAVPAVLARRAGCVCALEPPGLPACPTQHYRLPVLGGWRAAGDDKQGAGAVHGDRNIQLSKNETVTIPFFSYPTPSSPS